MKDWIQIEEEQKEICRGLNVEWTPLDKRLMIAVNESIFSDAQPVNRLRLLKQESMDGICGVVVKFLRMTNITSGQFILNI